jgi:carbon monoxide dehydrogenase subunit G
MAIELDNSFTVPVPPEQAWDVLLDVERIAPCMPGASVTSVEGDEVTGQVKVKLGPLSLTYKGTAKFTEKDQENHTMALEASGKETRGSGTASATVHAGLKPADAEGQTTVSIHTSLNVTGRPAQFGRSLLPEVSGKLIAQIAANLEALITADGTAAGGAAAPAEEASEAGAAEAGAAEAGSPEAGSPEAGAGEAGAGEAGAGTDSAESGSGSGSGSATAVATATPPAVALPQQEDSLNVIKLVGGPLLKRVLPVAAAGAVLALLARRFRHLLRRNKS